MTYLSDYRGMAKWFGTHYNQEVRFSSAVKCKKGTQVLPNNVNETDSINYQALYAGQY